MGFISLRKIIVFILELIVFLGLIYFSVYAYLTYKIIKEAQDDPVFQAVLIKINQNKTAQEILGVPIKPELLFFMQSNNTDPFAKDRNGTSLVIPIYGPKQTATLFAKLTRNGPYWHYQEFAIQVDGYDQEIDLLLLGESNQFYDNRYSAPVIQSTQQSIVAPIETAPYAQL